MNIAYLVNTYPLGSSTFVRREIQALERLGLCIRRFAFRVDRKALVDQGDLAEADRTEYVLARSWWVLAALTIATVLKGPVRAASALRLATRLAARSKEGYLRHFAYFVEACYLRQRCEQVGIAHIHAHFGTNSTTVATLVRTLGGPSYSFTVHGPEEFDMPLSISLGDKIERAAFVVGVSSYGRSQLYRWCRFVDWPRIEVVHCGFDVAAFKEMQPAPGARRLVTVGRFVEQKGQMLLIEALARVRERYPDIHLTMVGDGVLRAPIEASIARLKLEENVTITGWLDESAVRVELAKADALVLPSFAEGLPVVLMEAMASGRPVISTRIAGTPELVIDGEHGWLVPPGDIEALAGAMEAFAAMPKGQLAEMGLRGRARALERHDIDVSAARLFQLFEQTTAERHTARSAAPADGRRKALPARRGGPVL